MSRPVTRIDRLHAHIVELAVLAVAASFLLGFLIGLAAERGGW